MSKLDRREFLASVPFLGIAANIQRVETVSSEGRTTTQVFFQMPVRATLSGAYVNAENAGSNMTLSLLEPSKCIAGIIPTDWIPLTSGRIENFPCKDTGMTHVTFDTPWRLEEGSYYCLEVAFDGVSKEQGLILRDFPGHDKIEQESPDYPFCIAYKLLPIGGTP